MFLHSRALQPTGCRPQWPTQVSSSGYPPRNPPALANVPNPAWFRFKPDAPPLNHKKGPGGLSLVDAVAICRNGVSLVLFYTHRLDLFFSFGLSLERHRPDLNPGCFGRTSFDHLALLRRLLLDDVVVGASRRHQQPYGGHRQSQFLQHWFPPLVDTPQTSHQAHVRFPEGSGRKVPPT